ncbi:MAG: hypothetical protein UZ21_OP11001000645 [Microgenomates bacterium OLB22]|nr:MAG: hypothetical protein UZ21_OP11001000645 [Microgenomates bacterium OLB22]
MGVKMSEHESTLITHTFMGVSVDLEYELKLFNHIDNLLRGLDYLYDTQSLLRYEHVFFK